MPDWKQTLVAVCCAIGAIALPSAAGEDSPSPRVAGSQEFDAHLAPLLTRRCLDCHNASDRKGGLDLTTAATALAGGDSGPVIQPGKPEESLLWQRVAAQEMPPERPLSEAERQLLHAWIAGGAAWGTNPIDRFQFSSDTRAGYDWWSLAPVSSPAPPAVKDEAWPIAPLDRFVLARLEAQGLAPAPAADKRTLIRRLSYDLVGLPPTPAEVAEFVGDESPQALARVVDRLLASPHYGERWARHWLDVVRFGESQGFEYDRLRPTAYRYRDWLIAALNDDLPYDQFVRLQLAGDVLAPGDPRGTIATGFLTAGAFDQAGQSQQSAAMRAVVRQDELEDIVGVTAQTFLGLTANCARCHDHKFDPIRQTDYYRLVSSLSGARHANPELQLGEPSAESIDRRDFLEQRIGSQQRELAEFDGPWRETVLLARQRSNAGPVTQPIARWEFDEDLRDSLGNLHGVAHGHAHLSDGGLVLDGQDSFVATAPLDWPLSEKTLEVWVKLANLNQQGGGAIGVQTLDGATFDAIVFAERESRRWVPGSNGFVRTQSLSGDEEATASGQPVHFALVYRADRTIAAYRNGRPYGKPYVAANLQAFAPRTSQVVFGLRHAPAGGNRMLAATIERAQFYDRALSDEEIAASAGVKSDRVDVDQLLAQMPPEIRQRRNQLLTALTDVQMRRALLDGGAAYAVAPREPEPTSVLARGNPAQPLATVGAGGVAALAHADFRLPPDAPEAQRRVKLAAWITDPANPLTARVVVNRLWHYHFGIGLVDTPNDFGFNGGRPSHPELLDWLAGELVRGGWSLKHLHRTIVLSATYRQSSRFSVDGAAVDADNRLLWRKGPVRLDAEAIRDAMLSVAGGLNGSVGGPSFQDFHVGAWGGNPVYQRYDPVGFDWQRRSVYRMAVRGCTNRFLDAFDCPDPSTATPRRVLTTTPLQALAALNNSFVLRMCDTLAQRLADEAGAEPLERLRLTYELCFARPARPDELTAASEFVRDHGLAAFCRVLLNSSEFVYVD